VASEEWPIPPAELRRRQARALYEIEMLFRKEGLSSFVYAGITTYSAFL
jgi:hypothetical protein